jgi:arylsulfatase A-like enzyme
MPSNQPNILFILADDLGWGDVGYHSSEIRTPNIDRLVEDGIELDQHYVCPMCTPTRVSLMTGRHPGRFGKGATVPSNPPVLPDGYQTLASVLRANGYDTGLFGKWHLGSSPAYGPNHFGFNTSYGSLAGGVDPYNHRYKRGEYSGTWHRNGVLEEEQGHVTDLILNHAVSWIETREQPWFCYVPFTAVHVPVKAPQPWVDRYAGVTFDDDPLKDQSFKKYAGYASHMDYAVGQLIETLYRLCQRENTIIIFSSDNGAISSCPIHGTDQYPGWQEASPRLGSNAPLRGQKAQLYEGGIRTPTVISWLEGLNPGRCAMPMHIADWMPMLTHLLECTMDHDPQWDGIDVWPHIEQHESQAPDRRLFWNFRGKDYALREAGWKLILKEGTPPELYHIDKDPYETTDLAVAHPDIVQRLSTLIDEEKTLDGTSERPDAGQADPATGESPAGSSLS